MLSTSTLFTENELIKSEQDINKKSSYDIDYKPKKKITDPRFGEIFIFKHKKDEEYLAVKEKKIFQKSDLIKEIIFAHRQIDLFHDHVISLQDFSITYQSELCTSFYIIRYFYEYPKTDLQKEKQIRQKSGLNFDGVFLTHFLYQSISSLAFLHSKNFHHGDLSPISIAFDSSKTKFKLILSKDELSTQGKIIQRQKTKTIQNEIIYQSPLMFESISKGITKFSFNSQKEDAFALGLVILELGTDQQINLIYDQKNGILKKKELFELIELFRYDFEEQNSLLTSIVTSLLILDENKRPSILSIDENIPKYSLVKDYLIISKDDTLINSKLITKSVTTREYNTRVSNQEIIFIDTNDPLIDLSKDLSVNKSIFTTGRINNNTQSGDFGQSSSVYYNKQHDNTNFNTSKYHTNGQKNSFATQYNNFNPKLNTNSPKLSDFKSFGNIHENQSLYDHNKNQFNNGQSGSRSGSIESNRSGSSYRQFSQGRYVFTELPDQLTSFSLTPEYNNASLSPILIETTDNFETFNQNLKNEQFDKNYQKVNKPVFESSTPTRRLQYQNANPIVRAVYQSDLNNNYERLNGSFNNNYYGENQSKNLGVYNTQIQSGNGYDRYNLE